MKRLALALLLTAGCAPSVEHLRGPVSEPSHAFAPEAYAAQDSALVVVERSWRALEIAAEMDSAAAKRKGNE